MSDLDDIMRDAQARHAGEIDAQVLELAKLVGRPELGDVLARELRNLRADVQVFMRQRDVAAEAVKKSEKKAEESRTAENEARRAMHAAEAEAFKLRRLLHDLQVEVATWPRPT